MAFGTLGRQWIVWKAAWQAESGQPPNRAVPEGPAVEFLPEALEIQETLPSPIGRALLWMILIGFAIGVSWTILVKLDTVTIAYGRVVPSGDSAIIHPHEAGVITVIHAHEGQAVKQGEVLIELDPTKTLAEAEQRSRARLSELQQTTQAEPSALEAKAALHEHEGAKTKQNSGDQRILSPIDGVVQQLAVQTVGTVVTPARPLLMVVPLNRSVEVEAQVENKDVAVIHKGQPVEIKVDRFQSARYGTISGHVLREPDERTSNTQVGFVPSIRVGLDRSTIQIGSTEVTLVPGMAVAVKIKTGQRRMIGHLLDPVLESAKERVRDWNALVHAVGGFIDRRNL